MSDGLGILAVIAGFVLIIIPEPATTATGLLLVAAGFGVSAVEGGS